MNNHKKLWFAIDVEAVATATEAIESALNELGAIGTEIDSFLKPSDKPMRVSGYFETLPTDAEIREAVSYALRIYGYEPASAVSIGTRTVEQTDWLAEWKKYWRPTVIGEFIIAPPWEMIDDPVRKVIRIEPNMAFGTGTHETTQLCVAVIGSELLAGESFLDVGTGTGILAIAAAKLGDRRITACDIDEDSVKIAIETLVLAHDIARGFEQASEHLGGRHWCGVSAVLLSSRHKAVLAGRSRPGEARRGRRTA